MSTGWKSYAVAAALCAYAIGGLIVGKLDANHSLELILEALGLAGLRHAVQTSRANTNKEPETL